MSTRQIRVSLLFSAETYCKLGPARKRTRVPTKIPTLAFGQLEPGMASGNRRSLIFMALRFIPVIQVPAALLS